MKLRTKLKNALDVLTGERKSSFDEVQLAAVDRPQVGARVVCIQDHGPPGLEHLHGWLGLEGVVIQEPTADRIGALAVLQPTDSLPFPEDAIDGAPDEVWFLWEPRSWKEIA